MSVDMLVAHNPVFWVPFFAAGMHMTRIFALSRFTPSQRRPSWVSWGDLAALMIIAIALTLFIDQHWKFFIRQGLLMPFLIIIVPDLARGRGMMAKVFSLPGTGFMGETGFAVFIWQSFIVIVLHASLAAAPTIGPYQHWMAIALILALAVASTYLPVPTCQYLPASTYLIEKPIARWLRSRYIDQVVRDGQKASS